MTLLEKYNKKDADYKTPQSCVSAFFRPTCTYPRGQHTPPASLRAGVCASPLGNVAISRGESSSLVDHDSRKLRKAQARILPGGFVVRQFIGCSVPPVDGGQRGVIDGFSLDSRRRLRLKLMGVDWSSVDLLWVTLTYHKEWGVEFNDWKDDLENYIKRLKSSWAGYVGLFWRLEFQSRGAPHFHILLAFRPGICPTESAFVAWSGLAWAGVIGGADDCHLVKHGSRVVSVSRAKGLGILLGYLVKEMGKTKQASRNSGTGTGRMWGVRGAIPMTSIADVEFKTQADFDEFCKRVNVAGRGVSKYWENISTAWSGFVLLGDGLDMVSLLEGLDIEFVPCDSRETVAV